MALSPLGGLFSQLLTHTHFSVSPCLEFLAPIGVIGLCAQDGHGDIATAQAAARTGAKNF